MEIIAISTPIILFISANLKKDPAAWITTLLLFTTLMFDIKSRIKELKITVEHTPKDGREYYELVTYNTGSVQVGMSWFGYRKWDGTVFQLPNHSVMSYKKFEPDDPPERLGFYDSAEGKPILINEKEIYYWFIKTPSLKIFKRYRYLRPVSWLVRFVNFLGYKKGL